VRIDCPDPRLSRLVEGLYGRFPPARRSAPDVFSLTRDPRGARVHGTTPGGRRFSAGSDASLLSWLDDELTIGAQERRPDLLFVHAAALARHGRAVLLAAESGGGKSTTSWAALHHGFTLLSDELAPVDPRTLAVHPHPRAVCLKARPPRPYLLPARAHRIAGGFHVPLARLPRPTARRPVPLAAIVFVSYRRDLARPELRPIGPAEAAARLYSHALNPLAHPEDGLAPAAAVAKRVPGFVLFSNDLPETCALLRGVMPRPAVRRAKARSVRRA
jgi:hypothetical protein